MAAVTQATAVATQPGDPPALAGAPDLVRDRFTQLQMACFSRHAGKGQIVETLLGLAVVVAGLWFAVMLGGFAGFLLACVIVPFGGSGVGYLYNRTRNRDYHDAACALSAPNFIHYIQENNLGVSVDNIVEVYKKYQAHMAQQTTQA